MAFPCVCHKCARCLTLETLKDPMCLSTEKQNCEDRNCNSCNFTCNRYTEEMNFERNSKTLELRKLLDPL